MHKHASYSYYARSWRQQKIPREKNFPLGQKCYKTIGSYVSCVFIEIWSTWEVWKALKKLELLSAMPQALQPYKVLLLTCVVSCTVGTSMPRLCSVVQWSVHWAPSRTTRVLVLAGARHCDLETCRKKKNASSAFRLG